MSRTEDQLRAWGKGDTGIESRIELLGLFAHGFKTNRRGRRQAGLALLGLLLVVLAAAAVVLVTL